MEIIRQYEEEIPNYALSYIINADASGIDDAEIRMINNYLNYYYDLAKELNAHVIIGVADMDDEGSFNPFPAFGLACNTVKCNILICQ